MIRRQSPRVRESKPKLRGSSRQGVVERKTTSRCGVCGDRIAVTDRRAEATCSCGATTISGRRVVMAALQRPEPEPEPVEEPEPTPTPDPAPEPEPGPVRGGGQ